MTNKSLMNPTGKLLAPQLDYILVDGSGSMLSKWEETIEALDTFTFTLSKAQINTHLFVQVFDTHDLDVIERDGPIEKCPTFAQQRLRANFGGTPLYDAINLMARRLRDMDPPRARIVIITDGKATSSSTTYDQARAMLDWCRAKGWQVTFFGCDFNNTHQAQLLGADDSNSVGVQKALLSDAAKNLGEKSVRHAMSGTDIKFTGDEKSQFGGYLEAPSNGK